MNKLNQMGKTSFKSLEQISSYISDKISQLNNGQLNTSEIEDLTVNAQELYERLIVIRHKSYETFGESNATIIEAVAEPEINKEIVKVEELIQNSEEEQSVEEILGEISPMMSFDFSEPVPEVIVDTPVVVENPIVIENNIEQEVIVPESVLPKNESLNALSDSISSTTSSLNDSYKSTSSLADILTKSKINDLKSVIGINEKFSFITDLFAGSNENYNEAINNLNTCNSSVEAKKIFNDLANIHSWDIDSKTVTSFIELLDRRY